MQRFNLLYWDFPESLHNQVGGWTINQNGSLTVLIDSLLPADKQRFYLKHELAHIALDHMNKAIPKNSEIVGDCWLISDAWEAEANKYAEQMTDEELNHLMQYASCTRKIDTLNKPN